jgi:hypothetical protein
MCTVYEIVSSYVEVKKTSGHPNIIKKFKPTQCVDHIYLSKLIKLKFIGPMELEERLNCLTTHWMELLKQEKILSKPKVCNI